ncbi:hypothetical protein ACYSNW_00830 [Enterococcus sp. LJL99]
MNKSFKAFIKEEFVNILYYTLILGGILVSKKIWLICFGIILIVVAIFTNYKMFMKKNRVWNPYKELEQLEIENSDKYKVVVSELETLIKKDR